MIAICKRQLQFAVFAAVITTGFAASARLARTIQAEFGCYGFNRLPGDSAGPDASVTFLGPPFGPGTAALDHAEHAAERTLTLPGGGVQPGASWPGNPGIAWTAETAFFALSDAATGEHGRASMLLSWLAAHRTPLGALPEQVTAAGQPASVAPLAWTDAAVLLALTAQAHALPRVHVPPGGQAVSGDCLLPPLTVVGR